MLTLNEHPDPNARQLLFIDDENDFLDYIRKQMESLGYSVVTGTDWTQARDLLETGDIRPEIIFIEPVSKKKTDQVEKLADILECECTRETPIIVLSSERDPRKIVDAIQLGARDYICKPFAAKEIDKTIRELLEWDTKAKKRNRPPKVEFIFSSAKMVRIENIVNHIANTKVPVLITGESGTGKDVIARLIHRRSNLSDKPFVKVNCAAMPSELVESELFGYKKGAFTGAYIDRPGKFEFANGGTIFLDEIGEFTSSVQAKLLQVLQDGRFTRLGSNQELAVDVRVVVATNRKLEQAIVDGSFREDLYYRLNVVNIEVAPLRQRRDEIPLFSDYFLKKFSQQYNSPVDSIPENLAKLMQAYHWPGNVRELENLIKRFVVLRDSDTIEQELESKISRQQLEDINEIAEQALQDYDGSKFDLKEISKKAASIVERNMIRKALYNTQWNKWKAAKELKVSYKTLLNKMEEYAIDLNS